MITLDIGFSTTPAAKGAAGAGPSAVGSEAAVPPFGDVFRLLIGNSTDEFHADVDLPEKPADDEGEAMLAFVWPGQNPSGPTPVWPLERDVATTATAQDVLADAAVPGSSTPIESAPVPDASDALPASLEGAPSMPFLLSESMPAAEAPASQPAAQMPARSHFDMAWRPEPAAAAVVAPRSEAVQQTPEEVVAAASIDDLAALLSAEPAPGGDINSKFEAGGPNDARQAQAPTVRNLVPAPAAVEVPAPRVTEAMHRVWAPVGDEAREQPKDTSQASLRTSGAPRVDIALPPLDVPRVVAAPPTAQAAQSVAGSEHTHTEAAVASQMVQSMRILAADGGGEARVRLRPEYLGEVLILLKVEHGAVNASVQADSPAVRQWAETNEHVLRQGLGAHGLRLEQLTVSDAEVQSSTPERQADDHSSDPNQRRQQQRPRRQHAESGHERFEVVL